MVLNQLDFDKNEIYLGGDFNTNLYFDGQYILDKNFRKIKEAKTKHNLLKILFGKQAPSYGLKSVNR